LSGLYPQLSRTRFISEDLFQEGSCRCSTSHPHVLAIFPIIPNLAPTLKSEFRDRFVTCQNEMKTTCKQLESLNSDQILWAQFSPDSKTLQ
jgi:hypothetical protein